VAATGLGPIDHPFLATATRTPDGTDLLTGHVSTAAHPWLNEHALNDTPLFPGTAFLDLALTAATHLGHTQVADLTILVPLVLDAPHDLHVTVALADRDGSRAITVHARPAAEIDAAWTAHATGTLTTVTPDTRPAPLAWPVDSQRPDIAALHLRVADHGLRYGPAFQGLHAAWSDADATYAEAALAPGLEPRGHAVHPALLDSALHALAFAPMARPGQDGAEALVPYAWSDVALHTPSLRPSGLRVRFTSTGPETVRLEITDQNGAPVLTVGALRLRPVPAELRRSSRTRARGSLFHLDWTDLAPPAAATGIPAATILDCPDPSLLEALRAAGITMTQDRAAADLLIAVCVSDPDGEPGPDALHALTRQALQAIQDFLAENRTDGSRLVIVTKGAVPATPGGDVPDLTASAVWGLARSAQSENPDRILLLDLGAEPDFGLLRTALTCGEPQIAIADGRLRVPRLVRADLPPAKEIAFDPDGTVLITGGTGALGRLVARHLVIRHGATRVLLAGRRGPDAPGIVEFTAELEDLRATPTVAACDIADPVALRALLDTVPAEHPLTAVIHLAGVLADATLPAITPDRLDAVLRAKADAAWQLHRMTEETELSAFVLFSSIAGVMGSPGQGNYAAANAYLDGLAQHRHARGLPAQSLAWGLWATEEGMGAGAATGRSGLRALSVDDGLALLDQALSAPSRASLVPVGLDMAALGAMAEAGPLPAPLRGLVRTPARPAPEAEDALARRLSGLPEAERERVLLDLVLEQIAAVLGHAAGDRIDAERGLLDLGFDSLTAVELRNRLSARTGQRLPATLTFDYPTAEALARYLDEALGPGEGSEEAELRRLIGSIPLARLQRAGLVDTLVRLARSADADADPDDESQAILTADVDDLVQRAFSGNA
jgi:NAD(P)-dependent dehydrogenase (short-subunit alcohol dehydrogenase family)/acyl carrier protein